MLERTQVGDASGAPGNGSGKSKGGNGGFSKLFGSWGKGEKKSGGANASMPSGSRQVTQSMPSVVLTATLPAPPPVFVPVASRSLPAGFPSPPPRIRVPPPAFPLPAPPTLSTPQPFAKPHAATAFINPRPFPTSQSMSTMSTMSSSSFASTCASTDDWESSSEATTHRASSPEGSPRYPQEVDGAEVPQQRMWRVKGLASHEVPARSTSRSNRNSTPIPSHLLDQPSTPPRLKCNSLTSHASPGSPPFDPVQEKASRALRELNGIPSSPDQSGDADDEVSPPRAKVHRGKKDYLTPSELAYTSGPSSRMRIPSIRFEGISMDAVFAEVEKKMRDEEAEAGGRVADAIEPVKVGVVGAAGGMTKRRTRVFSMYRPMSTFDEEPAPTVIPASTSSSSSIGSTSSKSSGHVNKPLRLVESLKSSTSPVIAPLRLDNARSRPAPPRRNSSRPSPLNVAAANAVIAREFRAKASGSPVSPGPTCDSPTVSSPPLSGAFPTRPLRNDLFSPRDASFSPGLPPTPTSSASTPSSPGLGEAFTPHPSPALSTTSTLRGIDLPEVCVLPPTPTPDDGDWVQPVYHRENRAMSRVVVLEEKRTVKVSSRASAMMRRPIERKVWAPVPAEMEDAEEDGEEEATSTPPLSPAVSASSSLSSIGVDSPTPDQAYYDVRVLEPPSPSPLGGGLRKPYSGASDEDPSDAEEAIAHLLTLLHSARSPAPSTPLPPSPPEASTSSLTSSALRLHTTKTSSPLSSSSSGSTLAERRRLSSAYGGTAGSMMYESDDSATRFGDAPLFLSSLALAPRTGVSPFSLPNRGISSTSFNFGSKEVPVTITRSSSAASEVSSMSARPRRVRVLSEPMSDTASSSASDSEGGYESLEGGDEIAEVMMGERVSCGYDIGVAM